MVGGADALQFTPSLPALVQPFLPPSQGSQPPKQAAGRMKEGLAWVNLNEGCVRAVYRKLVFLSLDFLNITACILIRVLDLGL